MIKKYTHKQIKWTLKSYLLLLMLSFSVVITAQDNSQNWVKNIVYKVGTTTPIATPTAAEAKVSVTYFDGLGRPLMQIAHQQSNSGKDMVQPIIYDDFGRTSKQYFPYVASNASMAFDANAINNIAGSYPEFTNQNLYSETLYETSPLNRVLKQAAPGDASTWAMGSGHEIKYQYTTNAVSDGVKKFSVNSSGVLVDDGLYAVDQLYKTIVYNENSAATPTTEKQHATISFTNTKGQLVLSRAYAIDSGNTLPTAHDTYTVYDLYENVAIVIPPLTTNAILSGTAITAAIAETYQYKYDNYNRLIEKKEPSKNWQYIVYDRLNRVVATGPIVTPFGGTETETGWMVSYYDNLNRSCYAGWYPQTSITAVTRNTLQTTFDGAVANVTKTTSGTIDGLLVFYSSANLPSGFKLLSVNYYDTYSYPNAPTSFADVENQKVYYNATNLPKGLATGSWTRTLTTAAGAIVGETSYILYDYRARPIQGRTTNYLGGFTQTKTKVDFTSKVNYTITTHQRASANSSLVTTLDTFTYSAQDRLLTHTQKINNDPTQLLSAPTYNERGQLLYKKVGGTDIAGSTGLQKIDYTYNIRGWLKGINDDTTGNLILNTAEKDLFAYKVNYETVENQSSYTGTALFNGNIAEINWRTSSDNIRRKYGYQYDNLNRLTDAIYIKPEANTAVTNSYNEQIKYDQNGNIAQLSRNGGLDDPTPALLIDNLNYYYQANTNQLKSVNDTSNSTQGFKDNANATAADIDYTYDLNGNIKTDNNKGITSIKYNHLNLPVEIIFSNNTNTKITYLYTASGEKINKTVRTSATVSVNTDYLDGYQYRNNILQFFPTAEGYVTNTLINTVNKYNYVFNYTDHLGNVRLSYAQDPNNTSVLKIIEENQYYPYGLKHTNYNTQLNSFAASTSRVTIKAVAAAAAPGGGGTVADNINQYKFNGCELQTELNLNWYDMDMRDYDPAIARWTGIDPVTHYSQSPYNAFDNNPVFWADPSGADSVYGAGNHSNSSSNNPFAAGNAAVSNTGAWSGTSGGAFGYGDFAPGWGDGIISSNIYSTSDPAKIRAILNAFGKQNGYQLVQNIRKVVYPTTNGLTTYDTTIDINIWYSWAPYTTTAEDIHSALDVLGTVDPTPLSDGLNGFGYLLEGDVVNAGISAAGLAIPYAGDAAKLGRVAKGITNLVPLGLGSTGRIAAGNLMEQMAMINIISNPTLGKVVMEGMGDSRWLGWSKMQYSIESSNGIKATIHYVGKFENGVLSAVDDFKFK